MDEAVLILLMFLAQHQTATLTPSPEERKSRLEFLCVISCFSSPPHKLSLKHCACTSACNCACTVPGTAQGHMSFRHYRNSSVIFHSCKNGKLRSCNVWEGQSEKSEGHFRCVREVCEGSSLPRHRLCESHKHSAETLQLLCGPLLLKLQELQSRTSFDNVVLCPDYPFAADFSQFEPSGRTAQPHPHTEISWPEFIQQIFFQMVESSGLTGYKADDSITT